MPEIFGVSWGMYAILGALVVILVLLLIVSRRRRKTATSTASKPKKRSKSSQNKRGAGVDKKARYAELTQQAAEAGTSELASTVPQGVAPAEMPSAAPTAPQPPAGYDLNQLQPSGPMAPAPLVHSVPVEQFMPESDPLNALLIEVLSGWGEITQDDTNRLGVFRPERVASAIASMELPRDLRGNDQARARLSQLRRWAGDLLKAPATAPTQAQPPAEPPPQKEFTGMEATAGVAGPSVAGPEPAVGPGIASTPAPTAGAHIPAPQAPAAPSMQPVAPQESVAPGTVAAAATPAAAFAAAAPTTPTETAAPRLGPEQTWRPDWGSPDYEPAPLAPRPAQPASPAEPTPPTATPPTPDPTAQTDDPNSAMVQATKSTEAAIAAAAAAFWARPEMNGALPSTQSPDSPAPTQVGSPPAAPGPQPAPAPERPGPPLAQPARPVGSSGPDTFMADLRSGPNTAEAVLAMPAAEQAGALTFLKPAELAKVLNSGADIELKKTAIDQLRSVGSPEALDVIYKSLDNADPQLQAKALEAADKLLGTQ